MKVKGLCPYCFVGRGEPHLKGCPRGADPPLRFKLANRTARRAGVALMATKRSFAFWDRLTALLRGRRWRGGVRHLDT